METYDAPAVFGSDASSSVGKTATGTMILAQNAVAGNVSLVKPTKEPLFETNTCHCDEVLNDHRYYGTCVRFKCLVHGQVELDRRPLAYPPPLSIPNGGFGGNWGGGWNNSGGCFPSPKYIGPKFSVGDGTSPFEAQYLNNSGLLKIDENGIATLDGANNMGPKSVTLGEMNHG